MKKFLKISVKVLKKLKLEKNLHTDLNVRPVQMKCNYM